MMSSLELKIQSMKMDKKNFRRDEEKTENLLSSVCVCVLVKRGEYFLSKQFVSVIFVLKARTNLSVNPKKINFVIRKYRKHQNIE